MLSELFISQKQLEQGLIHYEFLSARWLAVMFIVDGNSPIFPGKYQVLIDIS